MVSVRLEAHCFAVLYLKGESARRFKTAFEFVKDLPQEGLLSLTQESFAQKIT